MSKLQSLHITSLVQPYFLIFVPVWPTRLFDASLVEGIPCEAVFMKREDPPNRDLKVVVDDHCLESYNLVWLHISCPWEKQAILDC